MFLEMSAFSAKNLKNEFYRKAVHLSSLWMPLLIYAAPRNFSLTVFCTLFLGNLVVEYACYRRVSLARRLFEGVFLKTLRCREIRKNRFCPSGSLYLLGAAIITTLLFPKELAVIGMTIVLISDTCAAIFGKMFGTRRLYASKSLEGTVMFFLSALYVMVAFDGMYPLGASGVAACTFAALCELYEKAIRVDDNFSVPLVVCLTLFCF